MLGRSVLFFVTMFAVACGTGNSGPTKLAPDGDALDPATQGDSDNQAGSDTSPPPPQGTEINQGWIGGACGSAIDCNNADFSQAASCETTGFPNGFCTQACVESGTTPGLWTCPDTTYVGTLNTTSRCIDANGAPRCVTECDMEKSPSGCRPGYSCVLRSRYNQASRTFPVCLPKDTQRWPGEPAPPSDIGSACATATDCNHLVCLSLAAGYCTKTMCDVAGCPTGSSCFQFEGDDITACLKNCTNANQCRTGDGHTCIQPDDVCWQETASATWDSTVGSADCAAAWGSAGAGLSVCDTTKDDYIVVHKSKRNIALCNNGALVANFQGGLGSSPSGDKVQQGDAKTPEGVFYIPRVVDPSSFYKAFLLSYPDKDDATRGLAASIITATEKAAIDAAQTNCQEPPQSTGLGGYVELHGGGGDSDWTLGCIATANTAIDQLMAVVGAGDTIVVVP
jgi:hypothetical protein